MDLVSCYLNHLNPWAIMVVALRRLPETSFYFLWFVLHFVTSYDLYIHSRSSVQTFELLQTYISFWFLWELRHSVRKVLLPRSLSHTFKNNQSIYLYASAS